MKTRIGFVSNSSSSSFIIGRSKLTGNQIEDIKNHSQVAIDRDFRIDWSEDSWYIDVTEDFVRGSVSMDNFDMRKFLNIIGVNDEDINWEY